MEFSYSSIVDPATYDAEGLCDGLPLRRHKYADLEEVGSFRAQEDWKRMVGPLRNFRGGLAPTHSIMSITMPECIPERLEIISYANEFAFLYDDLVDNNQSRQIVVNNDQMSKAFREGARLGKIEVDSKANSGKRQIQAKLLNEMLAIDRERAMSAMNAWATFLETSSGRQHHTRFDTLEGYLAYRCLDVGSMFWHALVTFGYALSIPESEMETCRQLALPAVTAASLTNDLFSYDKEVEESQQSGCNLMNGLDVIMRESCCNLEEAKSICRSKIKAMVANFKRILEQTRTREDYSSDLKRYIEVIQYSVSGNLIWSMKCPRYHKDVEYNSLQSLREAEGVGNHPSACQHASIKRPHTDDTVFPMYNTGKRLVGIKKQRRTQAGVAICRREVGEISEAASDLQVSEFSRNRTLKNNKKFSKSKGAALPTQAKETLSDKIISQPYDYQFSLPSKGVRERAIDALNYWLEVPASEVVVIKSIIQRLHCSSLMLDDIQDASEIRRGNPSTHMVYGNAQTINAATFQWIEALNLLQQLRHQDQNCIQVFIDEMRALFIGQSYDIHWTNALICPSVEEYILMVDGKTGGLFQLLTRLMLECSPHREKVKLNQLCRLFGRFFQIRDDYQNLNSAEYTKQKGYCEDLDEGKYSLPLIHALNSSPNALQLQNLLVQRRVQGKCTMEQKALILNHMKETESLKFTLNLLQTLHSEVVTEVSRLETVFGHVNHELRLLLTSLQI